MRVIEDTYRAVVVLAIQPLNWIPRLALKRGVSSAVQEESIANRRDPISGHNRKDLVANCHGQTPCSLADTRSKLAGGRLSRGIFGPILAF